MDDSQILSGCGCPPREFAAEAEAGKGGACGQATGTDPGTRRRPLIQPRSLSARTAAPGRTGRRATDGDRAGEED